MAGVSAIITAHDQAAFLGAAIDSVLAQELPADEILVVDDRSVDGTRPVMDARAAARPDVIRTLSLPRNRGAPFARNAGAAQARGELLAFLDGDDVWLPRKLAVQRAILDRHREAGYTYGSAIELRDSQVGPTPERLGSPSGVYGPPALCIGYRRDTYGNFWPSCLLIRRATFALTGGFVEALGAYQHWEDCFYACVLALAEPAYVPDEPLTLKPLPPEIVAALEERLERNVRQFGEALPERPELGEHASLYAPAALDRLRAGLDALRA